MHSDVIQRLQLARELLAERPARLDEAARKACLSPYHFHRTFSRTFGQTPHEFATAQRLARARRLLLETDLSVTEICLEVGYSSLGRFSSTFRELVGCSPSEFRLGARKFWFVTRWKTHQFVPSCFFAKRPVIVENGKIREAIPVEPALV